MLAAAPELMAEIAQLRKQFPGSRIRHFQAGAIEYGNPGRPGWPIPHDIDRVATLKAAQEAMDAQKALIKKAKSRRTK